MSKQAVHQGRKRQLEFDLELLDLVQQVDLIREDHPGCGIEKLYTTLKPKLMGRDKFCEIFISLGYRIRRIKNYIRTTIPSHINYPNLIEGMLVTRPFQVVQTDITYFNLKGVFYYIVFLLDVYTREILGYHLDDNMRTESNVKALRMALRKVPTECLEAMIHHSDRGSQYGSNIYTRILKKVGIRISMGLIAQDNAYAERINGTIKNEYLRLWYIKDFSDLKRKLRKAVDHYNKKRTHLAFDNKLSPLSFKKTLLNLDIHKRPKMVIHSSGNYDVLTGRDYTDSRLNGEPLAYNCPIEIMDKNEVTY